jgi:hypothetical protein
MNRISVVSGLFLIVLPLPATAADEHVVVSPDNLKWGAAPPAFPKGAQIAVLTLQLPTCFEMRTLSGGLVSSAPE